MNSFGKKYGITVIIVFGIVLRLFAYFRGISFWGDEAALALNVLEHSYSGLFKGLDYLQVAPPMFLVMSKFLIIDNLRDFTLRLIPLVAGIAAIPLFYKFVLMLSKNRVVITVSTFLFSFNMTAILYCAQFKQYSLELFTSVLLLIIFYKLIFEKEFKWYYPLLIAIAPWFSLSSLFIIGSYFLVMLIKNPRAVLKTYIPFFISFLLFYFLSLRYVSSCNYDGMYNWWQNGYGFADLRHPLRIVLRFGELFSFDKLKALFCGAIMLVPAFISLISNKKQRLFLGLPILLTFAASTLRLYPIEARLILFLLPLFVVIIAEYNWKFKNVCLMSVCIISFITSIFYTINPYKFYTSAREAVQIVENHIKDGEKIVLDSSYHRYYYYLHQKDNVIILKDGCEPYLEVCNNKIEELPAGRYYFILKEDPKNLFTSKVKVLDKYNLHSTVIYFEK